MYLFKLLVGILLIAGIPEVSKRLGPQLAGVLLLIPVISISALYLTATTVGSGAAIKVSRAALLGLIPLALFFIVTIVTIKRFPPSVALSIAFAVWFSVAGAIVYLLDPQPS